AQAAIARQSGFGELADNLTRAAELTAVPNEELLRMYEQLRPHRATYTELMELAHTLETNYHAPVTAEFVREAAQVYQTRNLLRRT
ncbi:MAG: diol dehydratase small subunit, partial [Litorilinea sp.]